MTHFQIKAIVVVFVPVILFGCVSEKDQLVQQKEKVLPTGSWEMVFFQSVNGKDTTTLVSEDKPLAITLYTPTHFSYHWRNSANAGSGTYSYDGKFITQKFEYVSNSDFEGAVFSFKMIIRNDSIIFSGPLTAESKDGKDLLDQVPQMFEIRKRINQ